MSFSWEPDSAATAIPSSDRVRSPRSFPRKMTSAARFSRRRRALRNTVIRKQRRRKSSTPQAKTLYGSRISRACSPSVWDLLRESPRRRKSISKSATRRWRWTSRFRFTISTTPRPMRTSFPRNWFYPRRSLIGRTRRGRTSSALRKRRAVTI